MKTSQPKVTVSGMSPGVLALNPHLAGVPRSAVVTAAAEPKGKDGIPQTKQPNATEQRMLDLCAARQRRNEIDSFRYEGITLKWGRDPKTKVPMRYTPDVMVFCGKEATLIEVKGKHIYERDLVRFKGCRAEWPEFHFEMWQWADRQWTRIL